MFVGHLYPYLTWQIIILAERNLNYSILKEHGSMKYSMWISRIFPVMIRKQCNSVRTKWISEFLPHYEVDHGRSHATLAWLSIRQAPSYISLGVPFSLKKTLQNIFSINCLFFWSVSKSHLLFVNFRSWCSSLSQTCTLWNTSIKEGGISIWSLTPMGAWMSWCNLRWKLLCQLKTMPLRGNSSLR